MIDALGSVVFNMKWTYVVNAYEIENFTVTKNLLAKQIKITYSIQANVKYTCAQPVLTTVIIGTNKQAMGVRAITVPCLVT